MEASSTWNLNAQPHSIPSMANFVSPIAYPNHPFLFGGHLLLPSHPAFSNSLHSGGHYTTQIPFSLPTSSSLPTTYTHSAPPPHLCHTSTKDDLNIQTETIQRCQFDCATEVNNACSEATDTIINLKDWVVVNLEEDGGCRIAGSHSKSGHLVSSEKIVFVNNRGDIVSDGGCASTTSVDGAVDLDETNLATLADQSVDESVEPPFLVLNTQAHSSHKTRRISRNRSNLSKVNNESDYSDSSLASDTDTAKDEPIPSVSLVSRGGNSDFLLRTRHKPCCRRKDAIFSSPTTVETGVQTSDGFSSLLSVPLEQKSSGRADVAIESRRTKERTPISSWMEEDMRLNVLLHKADIESTPSPTELPDTSSRDSQKRRTVDEVFPLEYTNDDRGKKEFASSSKPNSSSSWKSKESLRERRRSKSSTDSLRKRLKQVMGKSRSKKPHTYSHFSESARMSSRLNREHSHDDHHKRLRQQMQVGQAQPQQEPTLDQRHQLVTQMGIVDVRNLRRTRSGRLSVPTRETWHRQKIVFDGNDVSVDHGEYGKYFSSMIDD